MVEITEWLEPWNQLYVDQTFFEQELNKEIGKEHILFGKKVSAIGRRLDCDDILFHVEGSEFCLAVVHLTYSKNQEVSPNYPKTKIFKNEIDFINNCMIPDNLYY